MADVSLIAAKQLNIRLYQGDTTNISLTFTDDNDAAIDLSGKTFKMQIRRVHTAEVVKDLSTGSGIEISGLGNNILVIDPLNDLDKGDYVYDLQFTEGAVVTTWFYGSIKITQEVTI